MSGAVTYRSNTFHPVDLIWTLVRTDFKSRYHGTMAGFLWALLKPTTMFVVLMSVFSYIFVTDPQYKFNLIIGLFLWDFFAESTKTGLASLHGKGYLLTKARFPSWIVVVSSTSNAVITLGVFCAVLITFLTALGRPPSPIALAFLAFYLFHYFLIVVGLSLPMSVLLLRYRDLNQVWDVMIQAGFFVAPIVYPLSILPERLHKYLYIWPPTPIIQFSRSVLVGHVVPTLKAHLLLSAETAAILVIGILIFRRMAPRAAEYL